MALPAVPALAQVPETTSQTTRIAALGGTVHTEQGAPLAGATLVALHLPSGIRRTIITNQQGFLNLTGEVDYRDRTTTKNYQRDLNSWPVFSSNQVSEDSFLLANRKTYKDYRQYNGDARILNVRAVFNAGLPLSKRVRLYSFGTYNYRRGQAVAPWVLPSTNLLDLTTKPGFSLGYQPNINTHLQDTSGVLGAMVKLGDWNLDLSQSFGTDYLRHDGSNTVNPTLSASSPTTFKDGGLRFNQAISNATVSRLFRPRNRSVASCESIFYEEETVRLSLSDRAHANRLAWQQFQEITRKQRSRTFPSGFFVCK
ncbi:hypothetical protein A0257_12925 [Hymenobacter psoromatis]|nr:hypothetical protein A0257_12925 [Hymenobacter psoromatis]